MRKYQNWSKVLIEPSVMNDARLHTLELQMKQEEMIRIEEYGYLRDILKKFLYSMEQRDTGQLDER